ncbi:MAG: acetylxylan esterase [Bryobacterales bacterium]|nr:acetylxylan esterase [Bryobacterales bacterium]
MRRRNFLALPAAAFAQTGTIPDRRVPYRNYSRCLPDLLRRLAAAAYETRNRRLEQLTSTGAIREYQDWVTRTFWALTGGLPEKTPLNARTVGAFERSGYRVEKVVFESRPNFHVPANLYLPSAGRPPYPGVLFQMGHAADGKAYPSYQKCCQGLARLGFAVLAFDPMGQGERTYYPGANPARSRLGSADDEHTVPGKQMLLVGDTATRLQVWDAVRALDYLSAHPAVDKTRLGSTGQSGGGTVTMLLAAVDRRLAAAVVTCGNTENFACAGFIPPGSTDDAEQNLVNSGPAGFDRWDLLYPLAPKPLLVVSSARDFFGTYSPNYLSSGREEFGKLRAIYRRLGGEERIGWQENPMPHGLAYDLRLSVYNWFRRWLQGEAAPVAEEPPVSPEEERTLWVAGGNVMSGFGSESPFTLLRKAPRPARSEAPLDQLLSLQGRPPAAGFRKLGEASFRDVAIRAVELEPEPEIWLPAYLYQPRRAAADGPVLLMLEPGGRRHWQEGSLYATLAAEGWAVCAADLRGVGDSSPEFGSGSPSYAAFRHADNQYAWAALMLGRPLLSQRTADVLALAAALRAEFPSRPLMVAARGFLTVPALCAAALDPAIHTLYLARGLAAFQLLIESEEYLGGRYENEDQGREIHPFANVVFGFLRHTDLPQIAASLSPRRLVLAGPVDARGAALAPDVAARLYGSRGFEIRPQASWDAETFRRLAAGA